MCKGAIAPSEESRVKVEECTDGRHSFPFAYAGVGCDACRMTGYRGRVGVYEAIQMNERIEQLVMRGAPVRKIRAVSGPTMLQDAARKSPKE